MVVNNGRGQEFRNYSHAGNLFGSDADRYIAAAWHNGNKSNTLIKGIAESLGYKYLKSSSQTEYLEYKDVFVNSQIGNQPILFEVFTETLDESVALCEISNLKKI